MTYAFSLDASGCSGCKACQVACKDKNGLPEGLVWRRVIEVSGGQWHTHGSAWETSVFAYYLTLSCNHCTHPKCAGVCPTDAFMVRSDGIILINAAKCMGCGYCAWACPYGAPQLDIARGIMTKCDFCYDNLDAGLPPSCVAACPMRVLNITAIEELNPVKDSQYLWQLPASEHPFPLPEFSRTEPHLVLKPHPGMTNSQGKIISNREEIIPPRAFKYPKGITAKNELPLVAFTLFTQMAAGMAIFRLLLASTPRLLMLSIAILLSAGGLLSFLHLGRARNAWRSVIHLRKSWLSREVLMAGLFGATWLGTAGWGWLRNATPSSWPMAILGVGLIYSMARVYRLRAVLSWNTWRTQAAFFLSATVLGVLGIGLFTPLPSWAWIVGLALAAELGLALTTRSEYIRWAYILRIVFLGLGILGVILMTFLPHLSTGWMWVVIFIMALVDEIIGRWQFYAERVPFPFRANQGMHGGVIR
jgi:anaerobic dimethyl sulfoxide reductase subunit B